MTHRSAFVLSALCLAAVARAEDRAAPEVDYARQIKPLLRERCWSCHGALKQQSGLRLDTAKLVLQGGDGGPAVVAGKPDDSPLLERVSAADDALRMPPEGKPLSTEQITLLRAWIDAGARAPLDEAPEPDPRNHWSFQRVTRPPVPTVANATWVRNPIDAFLAAGHEAAGVAPSPPASRARWLRRVTLDLTGLPPSRGDLRVFLADDSEAAFDRVVDRLLDSPQYGERWARHWMDVWRYSDWYGRRKENDCRNSYAQIWRWRDWIVRSLNEDKGYDRMVLEMLAADEIDPTDDETVVATGYIVRNWYSLNYHQWMKDLVEHTGKAFLGLRLNCAHCHDHKYDPVTQEEYFRFRAFFEPLELRQDRVPGEPDPGPFKKYVYASSTTPMKSGMIRVFDEKLDAQTFLYTQGDSRNVEKDRPIAPGVPAFLGGVLDIQPVELPSSAWYPGLRPFVRQEELAKAEDTLRAARAERDKSRAKVDALARGPASSHETETAARQGLTLAEARVAAAEAQYAALVARIAADDAKHLAAEGDAAARARTASRAERTAALRAAEASLAAASIALADAKRKAADKPDDAAVKKAADQAAAATKSLVAARAALVADTVEYASVGPQYPRQSTGRRMALAMWIVHRDNPLAARVAVNHIWLRHFGRPLVESVVDFGRSGKPPTHPELLDWLAAELMDGPLTRGPAGGAAKASTPAPELPANRTLDRDPEGRAPWSMKRLHRLIVTSNAYRQGAFADVDSPRDSEKPDPASTAVASRSEAGPPRSTDPDNQTWWRFEPRRLEAEAIRDSLLAAAGLLDETLGGRELSNKDADTSRRRSLYFEIYPEDGGNPAFLTAFDAPDPCECYRRSETVMPQQALALSNGALTLAASRRLAALLPDEVARELGVDSPPEAALVSAAFEHVLSRRPSEAEAAAVAAFLDRQYRLYAADGKTAPDAAAARARESLLRALFNHTEFVTLP